MNAGMEDTDMKKLIALTLTLLLLWSCGAALADTLASNIYVGVNDSQIITYRFENDGTLWVYINAQDGTHSIASGTYRINGNAVILKYSHIDFWLGSSFTYIPMNDPPSATILIQEDGTLFLSNDNPIIYPLIY